VNKGRDFAALALRLAIGPMLVTHGYNKVWGGGGLKGTARWFDSLGLRPGWLHARLAAATEITAGSLVTVGALGPLPEVAVIGLMATAARTDHRGKGFFIFKGGWEYVGFVAMTTTALAALGHGRWSVDRILRRRQRTGAAVALAVAAAGVAAAGSLLAQAYRPEAKPDSKPESKPEAPAGGAAPSAAEERAEEAAI
jgi:putative oxidoreductase